MDVDGRGPGAPPPQQGLHTGDEDDVREGLGEVVVGARVQALGLVVLAVLGGEHQDRYVVPGGAQGGADPVTVEAGQHDVEDDEVVDALAGPVQSLQAVVDDVHGVSLGGEALGERHGEALLVLHDQQAHASRVAKRS